MAGSVGDRARIGLLTPIVSYNPRAGNEWELDAGPDELARVAGAADDLGYHHLTCSEHLAVPPGAVGAAGRRGSRYWDPFSTLGFLAAQTGVIRLATHVLVLPYHHPLELLKRCSTLDRLSGGRLVVGVGVGSLAEEFDALGVPLDGRGAVADEVLDALVAGFGGPEPSFAGERFRYEGLRVDPTSVQAPPPIWVGGRTGRSLRRALRAGTGWAPFALTVEQVAAMLDRVAPDRPAGFDVVVWVEAADDPLGEPQRVVDAVAAARAAGVTVPLLRLRSTDVTHHLAQLEAAAALLGLPAAG